MALVMWVTLKTYTLSVKYQRVAQESISKNINELAFKNFPVIHHTHYCLLMFCCSEEKGAQLQLECQEVPTTHS